MKKIQIGWLIILVALTSCQSSRFMQDDMYFVEIDAIREVREFENIRKANKLKKEEDNSKPEVITVNSDYYNFQYSSRLRRFSDLDNTWNYYDPYYTNTYWYLGSGMNEFGKSLYTGYAWWNNDNQVSELRINKKNWINPFKKSAVGWSNPWLPNKPSTWNIAHISDGNFWNTGVGYFSMYYNSLDKTSYWKTNQRDPHNFSSLMQKSGIKKNIKDRSQIEFASIKANKLKQDSIKADSIANLDIAVTDVKDENILNTTIDNNVRNDNSSTVNTTTKRWNNHNKDLKISPNTNSKNNNWSKSGVFSEGSRNNNYQYKGSAIPDKDNKKKENKKK